jgi:hypothetical protein
MNRLHSPTGASLFDRHPPHFSPAVHNAHHMLRETGGRVVILDARGRWQFTEHAQAHDSGLRLLNEFRAGGK